VKNTVTSKIISPVNRSFVAVILLLESTKNDENADNTVDPIVSYSQTEESG